MTKRVKRCQTVASCKNARAECGQIYQCLGQIRTKLQHNTIGKRSFAPTSHSHHGTCLCGAGATGTDPTKTRQKACARAWGIPHQGQSKTIRTRCRHVVHAHSQQKPLGPFIKPGESVTSPSSTPPSPAVNDGQDSHGAASPSQPEERGRQFPESVYCCGAKQGWQNAQWWATEAMAIKFHEEGSCIAASWIMKGPRTR